MKLKAWFVYGGKPGWYSCVMILENGWCPFEHLCSRPNFAPGDLFFGRSERMKVFKEMGLEIEPMPGVITEDCLPKEIIEKNKDESNWKAMSDQYESLADGAAKNTHSEIKIEVKP